MKIVPLKKYVSHHTGYIVTKHDTIVRLAQWPWHEATILPDKQTLFAIHCFWHLEWDMSGWLHISGVYIVIKKPHVVNISHSFQTYTTWFWMIAWNISNQVHELNITCSGHCNMHKINYWKWTNSLVTLRIRHKSSHWPRKTDDNWIHSSKPGMTWFNHRMTCFNLQYW